MPGTRGRLLTCNHQNSNSTMAFHSIAINYSSTVSRHVHLLIRSLRSWVHGRIAIPPVGFASKCIAILPSKKTWKDVTFPSGRGRNKHGINVVSDMHLRVQTTVTVNPTVGVGFVTIPPAHKSDVSTAYASCALGPWRPVAAIKLNSSMASQMAQNPVQWGPSMSKCPPAGTRSCMRNEAEPMRNRLSRAEPSMCI